MYNALSVKTPSEFVNYGPWLAAPRSVEIFDSPKLLMRRTDDRLMCAIERVQQILANPDSTDISALEAEIDRLVYALYGLTEGEIAVVEEKK